MPPKTDRWRVHHRESLPGEIVNLLLVVATVMDTLPSPLRQAVSPSVVLWPFYFHRSS